MMYIIQWEQGVIGRHMLATIIIELNELNACGKHLMSLRTICTKAILNIVKSIEGEIHQ